MKKTRSKKSRDTVPLSVLINFNQTDQRYEMEGLEREGLEGEGLGRDWGGREEGNNLKF